MLTLRFSPVPIFTISTIYKHKIMLKVFYAVCGTGGGGGYLIAVSLFFFVSGWLIPEK